MQTTWPTPKLENAGLSSQQERLYIEGRTNRNDDFMQIKLYSEGASLASEQNALEIKVENGQSLGRMGEGEWQAIEADGMSDLFAPAGDQLGYLVAAQNVRQVGSETRAGLTFTRFAFELDGLTFAEYMREQMEEELRRKGELPAGLSLDLVRHYVEMTGTGELWVNENNADDEGLPLRQLLHLKFPPAEGASEWVEAEITTDFENWGASAKGRGRGGDRAIGRLLDGTLQGVRALSPMGRL